jgi:hypothetical protein
MLNKEKAKRAKVRQEEYEGKYIVATNFYISIFILAIFSLKKSLKEYQKRLLVLGNATYNDQTAVC